MSVVLKFASLSWVAGVAVQAQSNVATYDLSEFQCFDDPKTITFENIDRAVDILPTVRMFMCGYSSQCALNMVAYLFMKERLGMNLTFFPTDDYDSVWHAEYWQDWVDPVAYPKFYFEWLYNDSMDLNFEFWPMQLVKPGFDGRTDYVLAEADAAVYPELEGLPRVDYGGFQGTYGEISIYIPKYWADDHPTHLIPALYDANSSLYDAVLMEQLINASREGGASGTDYIKKYENSTDYDSPNYEVPTIWGSMPHYICSQYVGGSLNGSGPNAVRSGGQIGALGLDLRFTTTGSEPALMELVRDLYAARKPFLANIYSIDDNFAVIDEATGELQQFEKLAFQRNPDQSVTDPCFLEYRCQNPVEPIMKAANSRLKEKFPEAHAFFEGFTMSTRQLNKMDSYYLVKKEEADAHFPDGLPPRAHTVVWLQAACEWLKSNDTAAVETWNNGQWLVDVVRRDCIEGCGIDVGSGGATEDGEYWGQLVGGSCNYYSGHCECDWDELFAVPSNEGSEDEGPGNCKESCPGLVGPFLAADGEYDFSFCSGHGVCDTTTRLCTCDLMYGDEGCSTRYSRYALSLGLQVVISLLSCILAVACILCIVWLRWNRQYKTVKALSIDLTTIMTLGLLMIVTSNIVVTQRMTAATCIAWQWLFGLGGILSIMSPLLKAYRVSRVFHGGKMLRAVKITDKMLMASLIKCAVVEALICVGYSVLHEMGGGATVYYNDEELRTEDQCNGEAMTRYVSLGSYAYFFVMLCALTKYSYGTRRALSVFQESTCAYFSSFLSLFCAIIVMVFYAVTGDPTFRTLVQSTAIIVVVTAVLALFYGTRIYAFFAEPEHRDVTDANQKASSQSASTTHNSQAFSPVKPGSVMKPGSDDEE